jgi:hypothetical protein
MSPSTFVAIVMKRNIPCLGQEGESGNFEYTEKEKGD